MNKKFIKWERDPIMSETENKDKNLIDATDSLEAVNVVKCWKNGLFIAIMICLLSIQCLFWLLNAGYVKTSDQPQKEAVVILEPSKAKPATEPNIVIPNPIEQAAKQVTAEPNKVVAKGHKFPEGIKLPEFKLEKRQFEWLLLVFNFFLVPLATLYCLTMLFIVKISLIARLGGLKHITKAFFLSLVAFVLILPWQKYFGGIFVGVMFSPTDLLDSYDVHKAGDTLGAVVYYIRFCAYWLVGLLFFITAQLRSAKWAKTMFKRLEIV